MFLSSFELEEKKYFLELAFFVANYNQDFADEQKILINEYRKEMLLSEEEYQIKEIDEEAIMEAISSFEMQKRKALYIEILSLLLSDKEYDEKEQEIATTIKNRLNLTDTFYKDALKWVSEMQDLYDTVDELVYG